MDVARFFERRAPLRTVRIGFAGITTMNRRVFICGQKGGVAPPSANGRHCRGWRSEVRLYVTADGGRPRLKTDQ